MLPLLDLAESPAQERLAFLHDGMNVVRRVLRDVSQQSVLRQYSSSRSRPIRLKSFALNARKLVVVLRQIYFQEPLDGADVIARRRTPGQWSSSSEVDSILSSRDNQTMARSASAAFDSIDGLFAENPTPGHAECNWYNC